MTDLDTIFAKIEELINQGHRDFPSGDFFIRVPQKEWSIAERSLNRSAVARAFAEDYFIWQGEYVERIELRDCDLWAVWPLSKTTPTPVASA